MFGATAGFSDDAAPPRVRGTIDQVNGGIWQPLATLLASEKWIILYRPAFGYSAAGSHKKHGRISR